MHYTETKLTSWLSTTSVEVVLLLFYLRKVHLRCMAFEKSVYYHLKQKNQYKNVFPSIILQFNIHNPACIVFCVRLCTKVSA